MNIVAIVQARMGSTRLPGKSALRNQGNPMIWHLLRRVRQAKLINKVVLAIPNEPNIGPLLESADNLNINVDIWFGNPNDLIGRYVRAADRAAADLIVRVPGDNPCVDPDEIDRIIRLHLNSDWKYVSSNLDQNILANGYPGGLGAEVWNRSFLEWLDKTVTFPMLREHPHLSAYANNVVITCDCPAEFAYPHLRFDVNTLEDFQRIENIYSTAPRNFRSKDLV